MNKRIVTLFSLGLIASLAIAATSLTVEGLLKDAKKFDKKSITVTGKVAKFEAKTSKKGNKYTVFQLQGKTDKAMIHVFIKGALAKPVKNGDMVAVTGTWQVEKKMGTTVYKNEIDASTAKVGAPQQVKILKAAAK